MSECKVNHSHDDVKNKFESQATFLPDELTSLFKSFFEKEHTQDILNQVFHLLKKYDLASDEEKSGRNNQMYLILR
ncbi:hypothetical protein [Neobacillus sp. PS3-40]|uniref:hypothetical protein n=1 Tax=Neobacillus sp. PS3-40 TaxID=3070679 RepID=UPI0027E0317F|nr:hypothetical protein [Neobacillus sp. PS3-40]WML45946.1 hypothetical protein RCG20_08715 [Neobacillus sp. PS3-40]